MRRTLSRRLLNGVTAVSLFSCVAVGVFWVRSYFVMDVAGWGIAAPGETTNHSVYGTASGWGRVVVSAMVDMPPGTSWEPRGLFWYTRPAGRLARLRVRPSWLNGMGFYLMSDQRETGVIVPHWFVFLIGGAVPGIRIAGWARRRRTAARGASPDASASQSS